jgi:hypothetical protein
LPSVLPKVINMESGRDADHTTTDSRACHFSLLLDQLRILSPNSNRRTRKASAEPTRDPLEAMKNPFIPYANPDNVAKVVCPIIGGNDTTTTGRYPSA